MGEPTIGSKTILLVDDDIVVLNALTIVLQASGHKVLKAFSGGEIPAIARQQQVDLIFLDLVFPPDSENFGSPLHNGLFVVEWLNRTSETQNIPVAIISSTEPAKYQKQALKAGVIGCLQKPLNKDEVLGIIEKKFGKTS